MAEEVESFKVTIDGIPIEVAAAGTTILEAARRIGGDIVASSDVLLFELGRVGWKMSNLFGQGE